MNNKFLQSVVIEINLTRNLHYTYVHLLSTRQVTFQTFLLLLFDVVVGGPTFQPNLNQTPSMLPGQQWPVFTPHPSGDRPFPSVPGMTQPATSSKPGSGLKVVLS